MLLNLPGKLGMSGDKVWDCWLEGGIADIRNYCETDVLNTFLVYLRFELMRGNLSRDEFMAEIKLIREYLQTNDKPHFNEFVAAWPEVKI
jgi:predicted PolB exonuclease-like 3'-5' exonuclease